MDTPRPVPHLGLPQRVLRILPESNRIVAGRIKESLDLIRSEPGRLAQTRHSLLSQKYRRLAFNLYAAGQPLVEVRRAFAGMALAGLRVAELRGTERPFLEVVVRLDPSRPGSGVAEPAHPPEARDFSLGNARANFRYATAALAAGEFDLARRIAALAWDPPDADWAYPRSTICTPNDQHLAYAVRHVFADRRGEALAELARVRPSKQDMKRADYTNIAKLVAALARDEVDPFLYSLNALLRWNEFAAENDYVEDYYLSLPGTGLTALALWRGLVTREMLPDDSAFLPLGLLDLGLNHASRGVEPQFYMFDLPVAET